MTIARWLALVLGAAFLAACVSAPAADARRAGMAQRLADDASAFNEAYGQAVTGQILLNILRARDRQPRFYLSMSGINDSPSLRSRQTGSIGSIPLGEGASPWGFGGVSVERETQSRPTYTVQPFSAETLTRTAFQPIQPYVFAHYWTSGWPQDLLLLLMVERLDVRGPGGERVYQNEANNISANCSSTVETTGCAFVRELRAMLAGVEAYEPASSVESGDAICGLISAHQPSRAVRAIAPTQGQECLPRFVVADRTYTLHLRSLDDVVYYVGELMRAGTMVARDGGPIEAQVDVRAAGLRGGGRGVPLFRIMPDDAQGSFAATVSYNGARYHAGPAIGRSCANASDTGLCRDDADNGDRSSSVISLLAELLALNQSPDAIRAPNRLFAD